jgi:hypothetical protein
MGWGDFLRYASGHSDVQAAVHMSNLHSVFANIKKYLQNVILFLKFTKTYYVSRKQSIGML